MTRVRVVNLSKRFGNIVALRNVSLVIHDREYVAVIGPSGCGKTTLIKCMAGILQPTEGEVYFDDRLVNKLPPEDRGIGYVFQEIALFPHMDVWGNVVYGPRVKGWPQSRLVRTARELLELIRLRVRERSYPRELSGGARQKVGLARALASVPDLLFLDEPLGSLDAKVRAELRYEIRNLVKDLGLTAIHITHDQEEAMSIADRVAVMKGGRLVGIGPPHEIYTKPENLFVANFVGEANFFEGRVVKTCENFCIVDCGGLLLESLDTSKKEGDRVVVAIRPEFLSMEKKRDTESGFIGHVARLDFEGSTIRYEVLVAELNKFVIRLPQIRGVTMFNLGDEVVVNTLPENVLVYPYPELGLERELALE
ncbi:MAG: ABC transporter ATP-binding protein [Candidatus Bathyarchaeia archaeon]